MDFDTYWNNIGLRDTTARFPEDFARAAWYAAKRQQDPAELAEAMKKQAIRAKEFAEAVRKQPDGPKP